MCSRPPSRRARCPARPRCGPWRSSTTSSATAAGPMPAASATSTSPATWTPASPSAPACSWGTPPTARRVPAWWRTRCRSARSARQRPRPGRCSPRSPRRRRYWEDTAPAVPALGSTRVGATHLTGNDLAPLSGLALLGLALVVGIAVSRGRGRWLVGIVLLALAVTLLVQAGTAAGRARSEAERRARQGQVVGVPAGGDLRVTRPQAGPLLALAGGALLVLAGTETLRRGKSWPALGAAFRAPPDRPPSRPDAGEPPWEGD